MSYGLLAVGIHQFCSVGKSDGTDAWIYEPTCAIAKLPYGAHMHFNCEFFENAAA